MSRDADDGMSVDPVALGAFIVELDALTSELTGLVGDAICILERAAIALGTDPAGQTFAPVLAMLSDEAIRLLRWLPDETCEGADLLARAGAGLRRADEMAP